MNELRKIKTFSIYWLNSEFIYKKSYFIKKNYENIFNEGSFLTLFNSMISWISYKTKVFTL